MIKKTIITISAALAITTSAFAWNPGGPRMIVLPEIRQQNRSTDVITDIIIGHFENNYNVIDPAFVIIGENGIATALRDNKADFMVVYGTRSGEVTLRAVSSTGELIARASSIKKIKAFEKRISFWWGMEVNQRHMKTISPSSVSKQLSSYGSDSGRRSITSGGCGSY